MSFVNLGQLNTQNKINHIIKGCSNTFFYFYGVIMKFCDAHNDLWYMSNGNFTKMKQYYKNSVLNASSNKIFCAYYSKNEQQGAGIDEMSECFKKLRSLGEKVVPTVENSWFLSPNNIEKLISLKPFCCTLTHNEANKLCGGAFSDAGFTNWGKDVVAILEQNGIIIDTAHMNQKSFYQFINLTQKPIFNSHCGFTHFFNHPRNLTDEQINIIVNSGGYIGLAFYAGFFGKQISSKDLTNAVVWFTENFGCNTLGFGTDFNGMDKDCLPIDIKDYTELNILERELKNSGVEKTNIEKLFNTNLDRFI